ncbi:MAG: PucR family transcriptional regulator ligand-binding domain-containing protein [Candidatus Sericytochromatia bacterium]|nr:PucR family transcriptional regulator ligand-binding domain-containing protein [Candidatus Sericytochromatia bacterium]
MNHSLLPAEAPCVQPADAALAQPPEASISLAIGAVTSLAGLRQRPPLQAASLLAGENGLGRAVQGIVSLEASEVSPWLRGGELVLSTGANWSDSPGHWLDFIRGLAQAGAAGLVLLAGASIKLVPQEALTLAESLEFPLLVLSNPGALLEVMLALQTALDGPAAPSRQNGLQRRLLEQVLDGSGCDALARTLARQVNRSVVVEDKQFNLLAVAQAGTGHEPTIDELVANKGTPVQVIQAWEADGTLQALRKQRQVVTTTGRAAGEASRVIHPLLIHGEVCGYLSVLDGHSLDASSLAQVAEGALAVALELLKQRGASESEQKLKRDFFRDLLLANSPATMETLRRRATYLGYPLNAAYWVVSLEFDGQPLQEVQAEEVQRLIAMLHALLSFRQAVVVNQPQGATILYPLKDGQPSAEKLQQLTDAIHKKIAGSGNGWSVSIGVGRQNESLLDIPQSFKEAQHALKIGRHTHGPGQVTFFSELGIYRMLLQFAQSQNPHDFFCEPLQRLIDYNQQTDKELVKTIAAFLECNGNLTETSTKLFIHRNTLKYRLERIRDITEIDLDDAENRLMLHLGLKMNQVINYLR